MTEEKDIQQKMTTYAVIQMGGRQYRVEEGEKILVNKLPQDKGEKLTPKALLFRPEKGDPVFAGVDLQKVKVEAVVVEHLRGKKIRVFKYKAKKGYRRRAGHRSELTRVEVKKIKMLSRKPTDTPEAVKAESGGAQKTKEAEKNATAKKPAATKKKAKPPADEKKPAEKVEEPKSEQKPEEKVDKPKSEKKSAEKVEEPKDERKADEKVDEPKGEKKSSSSEKED